MRDSKNAIMLTEHGIWRRYALREKQRQLEKLLELDRLSEIINQKEDANIAAKFLFAANNKEQAFRQLIGIGGGPGAGKSFFYDHMKSKGMLPTDAIVHDPDLVMQSIPQYLIDARTNPVEAFKKWELPARQLANRILLTALIAGYHIIYIRSFSLPDSLNFVHAAKTFGYKFDAYILLCNKEIAHARAKKREEKTQRHIPEKTLDRRHEAILQLIPEIKDAANTCYTYQNSSDESLPILML